MGTTPNEGLWPNTPQKADGTRTDPPMSVPISKLVMPHATAAAAPPDDPPGTRARSHGLFVVPNISLNVWKSPDHRGTLVFPNTIAPAFLIDATTGASCCGTCSSNEGDPPVDRIPAVAMASLIVTGSPCSGPHDRPLAVASSAADARSRATSTASVQTALTCGSSRATRASWASRSSTDPSSPARIAAACSVVVHSAGSVAATGEA